MLRSHPHRSFRVVALAAVALALATTGCAAASGSGGGAPSVPPSDADPVPQSTLGTLPEAIPAGEVLGQGTVLDDGEGAQLCLGAVQESYPPQCVGIALDGWDWASIDGSEEASGVRWGAYAVQGTFDGERLAITSPPILLALYDPMPIEVEPLEPGTTSEQRLLEIQETLAAALGDRDLGSAPMDGRLEQQVVYDDGTLQAHLDEALGTNVVRVTSALRDAAA